MKKIKKIIISLFLFQIIILAQQRSIHRSDIQKYGKISNEFKRTVESRDNIELNATLFNQKNFTAFGFLPFWEVDNSIISRLRFDLLTHIACFGFEALPTGLGTAPSNWPWQNIFNSSHSNGVKLILTVYSFSSDTIHTILTNDLSQQQLFAAIENQVNLYNFDGVNIDFENLNNADEGENINLFMQKLSNYFHLRFTDFEISFDSPAINWNNDWDLLGLSQSCDYLFVMEYDYFGKWSNTTGPVAPIKGGLFNVNITRSILQDYSQITNSTPKKLILGMPYFGARWETDSKTEGANVIRFIDSPRYRDAKVFLEGRELFWSDEYQNPWFNWQNTDTTWEQVWFDNDSSLSAKYDLAISNNLKGIGIWALNYDGENTELWDLMDRKLNDTTTVVDEEILPTEIKLYQNYPNPFNPSTIIKYQISKEGFVTLKVYDILGREVAVLVNQKQSLGSYEVTFSANKLATGLYIYRLKTRDFAQSKKMLFLR